MTSRLKPKNGRRSNPVWSPVICLQRSHDVSAESHAIASPVWRHRNQDCLLAACFERDSRAQNEPARYMRMQHVPKHANKGNIQACGHVPHVTWLNASSARYPATHHFRSNEAWMLLPGACPHVKAKPLGHSSASRNAGPT